MTASEIMRRPHMREMVRTGNGSIVLVIRPLRFFSISVATDKRNARVVKYGR